MKKPTKPALLFILGLILGYSLFQVDQEWFDQEPKHLEAVDPITPNMQGQDQPNISENVSYYGENTSYHPNISTCFTPPKGCGAIIVREIDKAKDSIYFHAYGLTSQSIIDALISASKRGVKVSGVIDRSNFGPKKNIVTRLRRNNIQVSQDKVSGIAHNKVMIIDKKTVITGSYNFTKAADTRNAENVLIIKDKKIAEQYLNNWHKRAAVAIHIE